MPKAEKGTPKDIANRMKAKGLQKLKFYCQMCAKQCRDENGFKCHLTSDSHLRQMKIFAEDAGGILDEFSREFETAYLDTLRRRHGTKRMNANNVYQEVIQDKHHVHMNATKWATLTDFVQYLGKAGKCVVDETERGWYVTYIERDPALLARQEAHRRRVESEKAEEEKAAKRMERQRVEAAKALDRAGGAVVVEASKMQRTEDARPVAISIVGAGGTAGKKRKKAGMGVKSVLDDDDDDDGEGKEEEEEEKVASIKKSCDTSSAFNSARGDGRIDPRKKKSRWDETAQKGVNTQYKSSKRKESDGRDKQPTSKDGNGSKNDRKERDGDDVRKDNWLQRDITVRIISKKLAKGKYYKRKGVVDKLVDKYTAEVEILDSGPGERDGGDIIRLDQDDLETVVPKEGKEVRILNGQGRRRRAKVVSLDKKRYLATLKVADTGEIIDNVDFEDFSKIA